jgi:L-2-hydroxyglutarate oxidase LhgO
MEEVECLVIGAGVVGLAVARALACTGREVIVVEREEAIGTQTSSRNSEVIHAGIYYPRDSLMARFCVMGRQALYDYCATRGVPHSRCGKFVVATDQAEADQLGSIAARARLNGVQDLVEIDVSQALALEPALRCTAALHSPSTGIVDSHALMLSLQGEAENRGAMIVLNCPFLGGKPDRGGFVVDLGGDMPMTLRARLVVNSAGLFAPDIVARIEGIGPAYVPQAYYARGIYFMLSGRSPFSRLIYPVPVAGGLGTHLTIDLAGQARFGPDVEWIDSIDYSVDASRLPLFAAAIRRYWPDLDESRLHPGYAGIRPKIVPPHVARQDFVIQGSDVHGLTGLINLFGIESPGLTASLAIADHVRDLADIEMSRHATTAGASLSA